MFFFFYFISFQTIFVKSSNTEEIKNIIITSITTTNTAITTTKRTTTTRRTTTIRTTTITKTTITTRRTTKIRTTTTRRTDTTRNAWYVIIVNITNQMLKPLRVSCPFNVQERILKAHSRRQLKLVGIIWFIRISYIGIDCGYDSIDWFFW